MAVSIFVSYSHKDRAARERLQTHLTPLMREGVDLWFDDRIPAGGELDPDIKRALRTADIFVALASPDYLRSEYCFITEYGYAMRRAARKAMFVVVAVIRPCGWKHTRMGRYKALPNDGKVTTQWSNRDLAYEDIAEGVRRVVTLAQAQRARTPPARTVKAKTTPVRRPALPLPPGRKADRPTPKRTPVSQSRKGKAIKTSSSSHHLSKAKKSTRTPTRRR